MAIYSQGCSITFTGATFAEVVSVNVSRGGGVPVGRDGSSYSQSAGTVSVDALGGSYTWGAYGDLAISGGGISLTGKAVCTGVSEVAQANDVTRYSVQFELIG